MWFNRVIERRTTEVYGRAVERSEEVTREFEEETFLGDEQTDEQTEETNVEVRKFRCQTNEIACQTDLEEEPVTAGKDKCLTFSSTIARDLISKNPDGEAVVIGREASTQVEHSREHEQVEELIYVTPTPTVVPVPRKVFASVGTSTDMGSFFNFKTVKANGHLLALTSVRIFIFEFLLIILPTFQTRVMSKEDALLLFLMKLKFSLPFNALGAIFNAAPSTTSSIFFRILDELYAQYVDFISFQNV